MGGKRGERIERDLKGGQRKERGRVSLIPLLCFLRMEGKKGGRGVIKKRPRTSLIALSTLSRPRKVKREKKKRKKKTPRDKGKRGKGERKGKFCLYLHFFLT